MPPQNTSVKVSDHRVESTWISVQVLLGVMLVRIKAAAGVGKHLFGNGPRQQCLSALDGKNESSGLHFHIGGKPEPLIFPFPLIFPCMPLGPASFLFIAPRQ